MTLDILTQSDLFVAGDDGYHTYRIPTLLTTPGGTLLAFCEGRRHSRSDQGPIDLLLKRSFDGGATWGPQQVVATHGDDTVGNPCPVVDRATGRILLLLTHNLGSDTMKAIVDGVSQGTRSAWITLSDDEGATWSVVRDITAQVKRSDWTWIATGPGIGIQLRSGRLLIPCDNKVAGTRVFQSHVILSDDGGESWRIGGVVGRAANECQAVELRDGTVLLNMRSYRGDNRRLVARSHDGGETFDAAMPVPDLIEPTCQASIIGIDHDGKQVLLFSNPASTSRDRMTVKASFDAGATWPAEALLHEGPAAYSCLAELPDGTIGCLYECGDASAYERITLARLRLKRDEG